MLQNSDPTAIAVIGGANLDIVAQTSAPLVAGDSNPGQVITTPGGVGRNVAHNLAALGQRVALFSVVGDDAFGRSVLQATAAAGVDVRACQNLAGSRSSTYLAVHGHDGDLALAVNDMGLLQRLDGPCVQGWQAALQAAAAWVLEANLYPEALQALFHIPGQRPVMADAVSAAKCERLRPWLGRLHTLKANRLEAAVLSGLPVQSLAEAQRACQALLAQGVQQVVLSLGADGCCWASAGGGSGHCAAPAVAVVNTSGAGDALLAGLVDAQRRGASLREAVRWGMACAALTVQSPHTNAPALNAHNVGSFLTTW
ncbi:MAG: PfkB family carbohydrate kinase [Rhodoferax sp.]